MAISASIVRWRSRAIGSSMCDVRMSVGERRGRDGDDSLCDADESLRCGDAANAPSLPGLDIVGDAQLDRSSVQVKAMSAPGTITPSASFTILNLMHSCHVGNILSNQMVLHTTQLKRTSRYKCWECGLTSAEVRQPSQIAITSRGSGNRYPWATHLTQCRAAVEVLRTFQWYSAPIFIRCRLRAR